MPCCLQENYKNIVFPTITPEQLDAVSADTPAELRINEKETVDQLVRVAAFCSVDMPRVEVSDMYKLCGFITVCSAERKG